MKSRPFGAQQPMPWGKHKGIPLDQVPRDYLGWCLREMDACNPDHDRYWPELRTAIEAVVGPGAPPSPGPAMSLSACLRLLTANGYRATVDGAGRLTVEPDPPPDLADAIRTHRAAFLAMARLCGASEPEAPLDRVRARVRGLYRTLSTQFHPDRGGSNAQQVAINAFNQGLQEILDYLEGDLNS